MKSLNYLDKAAERLSALSPFPFPPHIARAAAAIARLPASSSTIRTLERHGSGSHRFRRGTGSKPAVYVCTLFFPSLPPYLPFFSLVLFLFVFFFLVTRKRPENISWLLAARLI